MDFAHGKVSFDNLIKDSVRFNRDFMDHVQKGVFGLMIQGGDGVHVSDTKIVGVRNYGEEPFVHECKANDPTFKSPRGAEARGVAIIASRNVELERILVSDVESAHAEAIGVDVFSNTSRVS